MPLWVGQSGLPEGRFTSGSLIRLMWRPVRRPRQCHVRYLRRLPISCGEQITAVIDTVSSMVGLEVYVNALAKHGAE